MTVYVDDAAILWRSKPRFHMSADSLHELHEFAQRVGIKRCWFHRASAHPHYDVTSEQRDQALAAGARAVSAREMVTIARALRTPQADPAQG